jgi:hypothetical protein
MEAERGEHASKLRKMELKRTRSTIPLADETKGGNSHVVVPITKEFASCVLISGSNRSSMKNYIHWQAGKLVQRHRSCQGVMKYSMDRSD